MFIWSVRASTLKFTATLILGVVLVTALVIFLPGTDPALPSGAEKTVVYENVENCGDMAEFLAQFGVTVKKEPLSDRKTVLPSDFEGVFAEYNELQKKQGLDLSAYAGKELRQVVLEVPDYNGKRALATLYIYRNCVVGGDISSADPNGFVYGFEGEKKS